jgi:hypothetical protein
MIVPIGTLSRIVLTGLLGLSLTVASTASGATKTEGANQLVTLVRTIVDTSVPGHQVTPSDYTISVVIDKANPDWAYFNENPNAAGRLLQERNVVFFVGWGFAYQGSSFGWRELGGSGSFSTGAYPTCTEPSDYSMPVSVWQYFVARRSSLGNYFCGH